MTKMTSIFIVRAENGGAPESIIVGVYPSEVLAQKRIDLLEEGWEFVWFDEILVGPEGADCMVYNR